MGGAKKIPSAYWRPTGTGEYLKYILVDISIKYESITCNEKFKQETLGSGR